MDVALILAGVVVQGVVGRRLRHLTAHVALDAIGRNDELGYGQDYGSDRDNITHSSLITGTNAIN